MSAPDEEYAAGRVRLIVDLTFTRGTDLTAVADFVLDLLCNQMDAPFESCVSVEVGR